VAFDFAHIELKLCEHLATLLGRLQEIDIDCDDFLDKIDSLPGDREEIGVQRRVKVQLLGFIVTNLHLLGRAGVIDVIVPHHLRPLAGALIIQINLIEILKPAEILQQ
jgi:hypothetical protein